MPTSVHEVETRQLGHGGYEFPPAQVRWTWLRLSLDPGSVQAKKVRTSSAVGSTITSKKKGSYRLPVTGNCPCQLFDEGLEPRQLGCAPSHGHPQTLSNRKNLGVRASLRGSPEAEACCWGRALTTLAFSHNGHGFATPTYPYNTHLSHSSAAHREGRASCNCSLSALGSASLSRDQGK